MKGYKAFGKGMVCCGKQYAENTTFEEPTAEICKSGIHFCENPLDVLNYYPLIDDNGDVIEVAEVEALEEPKTDNGKKFCTTKLHIGARLSLAGFVEAGIKFLSGKIQGGSGNDAQLVAIDDYAQLASSDDDMQFASGGDYAQLASSGNYAYLASSGDCTQLTSSGDCTQLANDGRFTHIASSGAFARIVSSGNCAQIASSGEHARIVSSGKSCVIAAIGIGSIVKAEVGSWITLSEYDSYQHVKCVKTEYVDGEQIKADTWYWLKNGQFTEVETGD